MNNTYGGEPDEIVVTDKILPKSTENCLAEIVVTDEIFPNSTENSLVEIVVTVKISAKENVEKNAENFV